MYITYAISKKPKFEQQTLFDSILNNTDYAIELPSNLEYPEYHTVQTKKLVSTEFNRYQASQIKIRLEEIAYKLTPLLNEGIDKHYKSFKIPKHNGKFREIDAPDETLKTILSQLKDICQNILKIHPHNAAFAYIPKRSNKHAIQKHQYNNSKWFLHLDLKDFFSSCNEAFIHQQLQQIFPFSEMYKTPSDTLVMQTIIKGALYKERLPQGTPFSPFLTNIIMIPIDYAIYNLCKQYHKQHFVYTRYADDIDISSEYDFDYKALLAEINQILLRQSPLQINTDKVHYGSSAGRNWHLGLMLNQQNNITVGHKKKKLIKQKLLNYCTNKNNWTLDDIQTFLGELAYFKNIESDYHDYMITEYSTKYNQGLDIIIEMRSTLVELNRTSHAS